MTDEEFAYWFFHPIVIDDEGWRVVDITNTIVNSLTASKIDSKSIHVVSLLSGHNSAREGDDGE